MVFLRLSLQGQSCVNIEENHKELITNFYHVHVFFYKPRVNKIIFSPSKRLPSVPLNLPTNKHFFGGFYLEGGVYLKILKYAGANRIRVKSYSCLFS